MFPILCKMHPKQRKKISLSYSLYLFLFIFYSPYLSFFQLSQFSFMIPSTPLYIIIKIIYNCSLLLFALHLSSFYNTHYKKNEIQWRFLRVKKCRRWRFSKALSSGLSLYVLTNNDAFRKRHLWWIPLMTFKKVSSLNNINTQ